MVRPEHDNFAGRTHLTTRRCEWRSARWGAFGLGAARPLTRPRDLARGRNDWRRNATSAGRALYGAACCHIKVRYHGETLRHEAARLSTVRRYHRHRRDADAMAGRTKTGRHAEATKLLET